MLSRMHSYVVTGFHHGAFRSFETKQLTLGDAMSHAESLGVEVDTITCRATREVCRKIGREWTIEKYLPPKRIGERGEHNLLYLASFIIPVVGLGVGGYRAYCGMAGGRGAVVAGGLGLVAWAVGYVVISKYA